MLRYLYCVINVLINYFYDCKFQAMIKQVSIYI